MYTNFQEYLKKELAQIEADGLYKNERIIESPQGAEILVKGKKCLNFCANNYLGLGNNPELIEAAKRGMDERGFGMASVRFICGCQDLHKKLEAKIAEFFGTEDTILYAACFDAMNDDFNSPIVIANLFEAARIVNSVRDGHSKINAEELALLKELFRIFVFEVLGLLKSAAAGMTGFEISDNTRFGLMP